MGEHAQMKRKKRPSQGQNKNASPNYLVGGSVVRTWD